jgi:hypothetical protein
MMNENCAHPHFETFVDLNRINHDDSGLTLGYRVEFRLRCFDCKSQFEFVGLPPGSTLEHPTVGLSRTAVYLPVRPVADEPAQIDALDAPAA